MERYVKQFFDALEENKLPGQRCRQCGRIRFGYVPICDMCKAQQQEPIELTKHGLLTVFSIRQHWDLEKRYQNDFPGCMPVGCVTLDNGPELWCSIFGINTEKPEKTFAQLPIPVKIEIRRIGGNMIPVAVIP